MPSEPVHDTRVRLLSSVNALLGLLLILFPWIVGAPGPRVGTNGIAVGVVVLISAGVRFAQKHTNTMSWTNVLLGAWTVMSPWVLGQYSGDFRTWNYVIVGVLIVAIEAYSLTSSTTQPNWRQSKTGRR